MIIILINLLKKYMEELVKMGVNSNNILQIVNSNSQVIGLLVI